MVGFPIHLYVIKPKKRTIQGLNLLMVFYYTFSGGME